MENRRLLIWIIFFVEAVNLSSGQETVTKPKFPDEFQVEIQGIFTSKNDKDEDVVKQLDASLYYDKKNNRVAVFYTYQKERSELIYNFDDNEILSFDGIDCSVEEIPDDPLMTLFFQFKKDEKAGKKVIVSPEEIFFFTKSVLSDEAVTTFPVYTYQAKIAIPEYGRKNCDVRHIFTKPAVETPDCDSQACEPKLVSISVACEAEEGGEEPKRKMSHVYNFFRFKSGIEDKGVFQPPPGIYCNSTSRLEFPRLPDYFSFSYDYQVDSVDHELQSRVDSTHKKVWYHSSLGLIRLDEFDENGLLVSSRILDFYSGTAFTIISHLGECEKGTLEEEEIDLSELTRLPKLIFQKDLIKGDAVYIGKKKAHGIVYDVWVSSISSSETDAVQVEEFFFSKVDEKTTTYRLSHVDIHIYARNPESGAFESSANAFYAINNFRYELKEWKAFDISACFEHDRKKAFKLEVEGPSVVKNSLEFENLLEKLYMKIIIYTNVSISRVSDLTDIHDGTHLNGFNGFILEKPDVPGVNASELEPDMNRAYELLSKASSSGKLNIKIKFNNRDVQYKIKLVEEKSSSLSTPGWAIAAIAVLTVVSVIIISCWIFYVFKKKKEDDDSCYDNPLPMGRVN